MSQLSLFAAAASKLANPVIGSETVTIDGTGYSAILNESTKSRESDIPGFIPSRSLRAVFAAADAPAGDCVGKLATARGTAYRVAIQTVGVSFVTLELTEKERA